MPRKAKNSASAPDLLGTAPNIPQTPKKVAERTESALTDVPAAPASPADIILDEYGIAANCTNVPQILRAIICEMVRGRV